MDKIKSSIMPTIEEAKDICEEGVKNDMMIVVMARCVIDYDGRAVTEGYLPEGERLIFIKKDGTMHVHSTTKKQPIRWQNSGAEIDSYIEDGELILETRGKNKGTEDVVTVFLRDIHQVSSYNAVDKRVSSASDSLRGTEEDMKSFIKQNPDYIEEGFEYIEEERVTEEGPVDIFGRSNDGSPIILELKARHAQKSHVRQLAAYTEKYEEKEPDVKGILVAPSVADSAKKKLDEKDLGFIKLHPRDSIQEMGTSKTNLDEFQ
jgi:RecB family endonuclease NucS